MDSELRSQQIARVLLRVLFLNLAVALVKILLGTASGAVSVLSDGFHSLTDASSNVVALVGVRAARRPPDVDHPYGHRKFETIAAVGIVLFLLLVMVQVLWAALQRLRTPITPVVDALTFAVLVATLGVNVAVVAYERRAAKRLNSEVLLADAHHTQSDLYTSLTVIAALVGVQFGWPLLDPLAAFVVAGFIGFACWEIFRESSPVLADRIVLSPEEIAAVVREVSGVLGCHEIRSRGTADHVFVDLHIWMNGAMRLDEAHALSHVVKDRLMTRYPQVKDAVIHLEPPPAADQ